MDAWRTVVALAFLFAVSGLPGTGVASAAFLHPASTGSVGPDGSSETTFGSSTVRGLQYDNARDRLYVLRPSLYGNSSGENPPQLPRGIFALDASAPGSFVPLGGGFPIPLLAPSFLNQSLAVDETEGNIYLVESKENDFTGPPYGRVLGWDSSGTPLGGNFPLTLTHSVCGSAVDPLGYLWLANSSQEKLFKYNPDGSAAGFVDVSPLSSACEIAFDKTNGDIWLRQNFGGIPNQVSKLTAASGYTQQEPSFPVPGTSNPEGLVFDSSSGLIYTLGAFHQAIGAYNESGGLVETFAATASHTFWMALDEERGRVFAVDETDGVGFEKAPFGGKVRVWSGVVVPDVDTGPPADIGHTGATLTGHLDLAGGPGVTSCEFQYGTDTTYSSGSLPCVPAASPGSPITEAGDVEADVSGLTTGTTYHYRLVAGNANGTNLGTDETLTPQPSLVKTGAATGVQRSTATLNGTVDPEGLETTYYFEYGKSKSYGQASDPPPGVNVGTTTAGDQPVSVPLAGLEPGATYHYRLVAVNSKGTSFGVDRTFATNPAVKDLSTDPATDLDRTDATLNGTLDPDGLETKHYFEWGRTKRYGQTSAVPPGDDVGTTAPGAIQVSALAGGLKPDTTYHYRLVASNAAYGTTNGDDRTFTTSSAVKELSTDAATDVEPTGATLNGKLDPDGIATSFYFEWGKTAFYGHVTAAAPGDDVGTTAPGILPLDSDLEGLEPGTTYHYRLVAVNSFGTTVGKDVSFSTPQAPSIEGVFSDNVTTATANLKAKINPNGFETTYRFEYGPTSQYGSSVPVPDGVLAAGNVGQSVVASLNGLEQVTYHFRLVAENQWGTTTSEDQTFDFNPPNCPNAAVRQQTGAAYLPDCRAYELVSPARIGGAALFPVGPTSPLATNRLAFTGMFNVIPGTGEPPNGGTPFPSGDLYVATRTTGGWVTRYVGLPAYRTIEQTGDPSEGLPSSSGMLADGGLSRFLTWDNAVAGRSYAPFVWDNEGNGLGRLPTNLEGVPGAANPISAGGFVGAAKLSPDFSHYVFSSRNVAFAAGGLTSAPGSVYDNHISDATVTIVSKAAGGGDIPQDGSAGGSGEYIRVPAVSTDGSHILMSTEAPGGTTHLYMRVNDAVSYDVSVGADTINRGVSFEGMTGDGGEVYFTTAAQMTVDDHDSSVDLYRWSENGGSPQLTRLSDGDDGFGDTDSCNPAWTTACNVEVVPTDTHVNGFFGNDKLQPIDSALAADSGDVYFYSPEELDGSRGVPGERNLYVWRAGAVHHVATLDVLSGVERINVSPDGGHMAFITKSRLSAYDNAGHAQMHTYDPTSRSLLCVSCLPDGSPPTSDVEGSQNGIFMTDDGRAFFSTRDAMVPRDANGGVDVYEYVNGRAQLISTGTGEGEGEKNRPIGLVGVGADGTNAFISTSETLVGQDESGPFYKFYVARVNGGFPFSKPPAPCAAADECHGTGSSTPASSQIGSGAALGGTGNSKATRAKKAKRAHRKKRHRHRAEKHRRHRGVRR